MTPSLQLLIDAANVKGGPGMPEWADTIGDKWVLSILEGELWVGSSDQPDIYDISNHEALCLFLERDRAWLAERGCYIAAEPCMSGPTMYDAWLCGQRIASCTSYPAAIAAAVRACAERSEGK